MSSGSMPLFVRYSCFNLYVCGSWIRDKIGIFMTLFGITLEIAVLWLKLLSMCIMLKKNFMTAGGIVQWLEYLPSMYKALGSILVYLPSLKKKSVL